MLSAERHLCHIGYPENGRLFSHSSGIIVASCLRFSYDCHGGKRQQHSICSNRGSPYPGRHDLLTLHRRVDRQTNTSARRSLLTRYARASWFSEEAGRPIARRPRAALCPISALSRAVEQDLLTLHPSHRTLCAFADVVYSDRAGVGSQLQRLSVKSHDMRQIRCLLDGVPHSRCHAVSTPHFLHFDSCRWAPVGQTESLT